MNKHLYRALAALCLSVSSMAALAAYPDHPIRLEVGFPPGTGPDIVAREVGMQLGKQLGHTVVVENKSGAGGQIAAFSVAHAKPDGYTILLGEVGSISIAPETTSKLPYKPLRDFVPITEAVLANFVLVTPANSPYKNLHAFVDGARRSKTHFNMATFGAGTPGHFGAEMLAEAGGFKVEPVHYRSTGDAVQAIIAGQVQGAFLTTAMARPQILAGRMRGLAITGSQRSALLPDIPTFAQQDLSAVDFGAWFAFLAPAGTPADRLETLNKQIRQALGQKEVSDTLKGDGFDIIGSSRADMDKLLHSEQRKWAQQVRKTGFRIN